MSDNYAQFSAAVMTSLLRVLRTFAKTERTINIMGKTVASRAIVLTDALKDFNEVVVDETNRILSTPQGRMVIATQMMQFGAATRHASPSGGDQRQSRTRVRPRARRPKRFRK
jgi:hypothetical protein